MEDIGESTSSFEHHWSKLQPAKYTSCVCQAPMGPPRTPVYPFEKQTLTFQRCVLAFYRHQRLQCLFRIDFHDSLELWKRCHGWEPRYPHADWSSGAPIL